MEILQLLNSLSLPGWLIVIAASLFILRTVGLLNPIVNFFSQSFGFIRQQAEAKAEVERAEQVALQVRMAELQQRALDENSLLLDYIINDVREMLEEIQIELRSQKLHNREIAGKLTLLVGILSDWYDRRKTD